MAVSENNRKFAIGKQRLGIMVEINDRKLPVGIQSFEKIRKDGYLYVDKTDIIWQLANRNKTYNYLSRPRRFGKSVLSGWRRAGKFERLSRLYISGI